MGRLYRDPLPGIINVNVVAVHFRSGLFLSTTNGVVMSQLLRAEQPQIDLAPLWVGR
jgi:hypothetical protein